MANFTCWSFSYSGVSALTLVMSTAASEMGVIDPSGLIVSEALRGEKASLAQAIDNSTRAGNMVGTAESALSEVSALLVSIKDLVTDAANSGAMSDAEMDANQLAIDSAVDSVTRIAKTTRFSGQYLLIGYLPYRTSGVTASQLAGVKL